MRGSDATESRFWLLLTCLVLTVLCQPAIAGETIRYVPANEAPIAYSEATKNYEEGESFDPLSCAELACLALLHNIFDPLVSTASNRELRPGLATRWERLDDVTYRFFLREGVTFQNGEEFNAESVRYSILEASRAFASTAWLPEIVDVKILDKYTVDVVLSEADSLFLYRLNHLVLIRPVKYFRRMGSKRFGKDPIGTGAFKFEAWDPEKREIRLTANDRYWRPGFPKVGTLIYQYTESQIALQSLISGDVDLIRRMNPRKTTQFLRSGKGSVVKAWLPQSSFGVFNLLQDDTPLADVRVRKAINFAINRDHLIRYGFIGNARLLAGYSLPDDPNRAALESYPFNPTLARKLLADAGYSNGLTIKLAVANFNSPDQENIIARSLAEVGIHVELQRIFLDDELAAIFTPKFGGEARPDFDILMVNTPMEAVYHTGYVPMTWLYSRKPNYSLVRDAYLDDLYEQALASYDEAKSSALWKKIETYVYDNHLFMLGYQERAVFAASRGLKFTPRLHMNFWDAHYGPSDD